MAMTKPRVGQIEFNTPLPIANGGTGATTAAAAFDNLKQAATATYVGAVELATDAEAIAGTDTTRVLTPANLRAANIVAGTAQTAPASPTPLPYIDFISIPSWVKRITIMFNGISTSGTSAIRIRCGSDSIQSSGYAGYNLSYSSTALAGTNISNGFDLAIGAGDTAAAVRHGVLTLSNITGNTWVANGSIGISNNVFGGTVCGSVTLSGALNRIYITTVNGTDTFDAGTVNILWE